MNNRFDTLAAEWDKSDMRSRLSYHIGKAILENVDFDEKMHLMDFGAGTGLLTGHVANNVAKVAAVDLSQGMLDQLARKEALTGVVTPYCRDIQREPFEEPFDGIVSAMALHHVEDTEAIARTFFEHLTPGGFIALADLDAEDGRFHAPGVEGVYHHGFERDKLRSVFEKAGFNGVTFTTAHTVEKPEGNYPIFLMCAKR